MGVGSGLSPLSALCCPTPPPVRTAPCAPCVQLHHSAMEYGRCWFTGTGGFQSQKLRVSWGERVPPLPAPCTPPPLENSGSDVSATSSICFCPESVATWGGGGSNELHRAAWVWTRPGIGIAVRAIGHHRYDWFGPGRGGFSGTTQGGCKHSGRRGLCMGEWGRDVSTTDIRPRSMYTDIWSRFACARSENRRNRTGPLVSARCGSLRPSGPVRPSTVCCRLSVVEQDQGVHPSRSAAQVGPCPASAPQRARP